MGQVIVSLLLSLGQLADGRTWRIIAKSVGVSLVLFVVVAAAGWWAIDAGLAAAGLGEGASGDVGTRDLGALRGAAAALLTALGLWLTWRIVAMAVVGFYADEVVEAVEARHYPEAASAARRLSLGEQAGASARSAARALLVNLLAAPLALALLVTGIGPALLFLAINAWLIGRELQDMVWLRHRPVPVRRPGREGGDVAPLGTTERLALGGAVAALMLVPFANFLAPVLGAASATHLVHRPARGKLRT